MLDSSIVKQLTEVFDPIEIPIQLRYDESTHAKQNELIDLLTQVAETSPHLSVVSSSTRASVPGFEILKDSVPAGIRFHGIPGGHEFTSLIIAVLNTAGKGKWPDDIFQTRIKRLKGPIHLRTFMSLSCENCPDVIQALNRMALLHPDFTHEILDGDFFGEESDRLGIQGVPAVFHQDTLLSSGKADLLELLDRLEAHFGTEESVAEDIEPIDLGEFDVVVSGGGPAGVSAAIYTARKGLKTAIVADRIGGQLMETKGIENMISIPYTEGPELSAGLIRHVENYPVKQLLNRRIKTVRDDKTLTLTTGETLKTKALVVATGSTWRKLNIPGEADFLGKGVAYCPHCDGPFYKGKSVAVIGGGNSGVEAAIDLAGIVKHVTVIEYGNSLRADEVLIKRLKSLPNTAIITSAKTIKINGTDSVEDLVYEDTATAEIRSLPIDGIFVQIGLIPNSDWIKEHVERSPYGEIIIDNKCKTSTPWIYAAGDVTTVPFKQIIVAMGEGAKAGLAVFEALTY